MEFSILLDTGKVIFTVCDTRIQSVYSIILYALVPCWRKNFFFEEISVTQNIETNLAEANDV